MLQSAHLNLLVSLLKGHYEAVHDQLNDRGFDSEGFRDLLARHQLRGYVYSILTTSPAADAFPPDLIDSLKPFYIRQRTRNEQMMRELKLLSLTFSLAGQQFILLKGPYLAKRFYGDLDQRVFWDIDILIKRDELGRAKQLLTRSGFARQSWILFNELLTIYFTHALEFTKSGVTVDLHWTLKNRPSYTFNHQSIWDTKREFYFDDTVLYVLSDEYALVFTLISMFNDIEVGKIRLKSFVDLYKVIQALTPSLDWGQFLEDRKEENAFKISVNMLNLCLNLFDCHREFPDLARALSQRKSFVEATDAGTIERLLTHSRVGMTHRMWAARLYQGSRLRFLLWWMVSMPFRRAAFRSGKSSRLKRPMNRLRRHIGLKRSDRR